MPQKQTHLTYPIKILLILKIPVFISHNSGILGLLSTQRTGCSLDVTFFTKSAVCLSFLCQHGFPNAFSSVVLFNEIIFNVMNAVFYTTVGVRGNKRKKKRHTEIKLQYCF